MSYTSSEQAAHCDGADATIAPVSVSNVDAIDEQSSTGPAAEQPEEIAAAETAGYVASPDVAETLAQLRAQLSTAAAEKEMFLAARAADESLIAQLRAELTAAVAEQAVNSAARAADADATIVQLRTELAAATEERKATLVTRTDDESLIAQLRAELANLQAVRFAAAADAADAASACQHQAALVLQLQTELADLTAQQERREGVLTDELAKLHSSVQHAESKAASKLKAAAAAHKSELAQLRAVFLAERETTERQHEAELERVRAAAAAELEQLRAATAKKTVKFNAQQVPVTPKNATSADPAADSSAELPAAASAELTAAKCTEHARSFRQFCRTCNVLLCDTCYVPAKSAHRQHETCGIATALYALQDQVRAALRGAAHRAELAEASMQHYLKTQTRLNSIKSITDEEIESHFDRYITELESLRANLWQQNEAQYERAVSEYGLLVSDFHLALNNLHGTAAAAQNQLDHFAPPAAELEAVDVKTAAQGGDEARFRAVEERWTETERRARVASLCGMQSLLERMNKLLVRYPEPPPLQAEPIIATYLEKPTVVESWTPPPELAALRIVCFGGNETRIECERLGIVGGGNATNVVSEGERIELQLQLRDTTRAPFLQAGWRWSIDLARRAGKRDSLSSVAAESGVDTFDAATSVSDRGSGLYVIAFNVPPPGQWRLAIFERDREYSLPPIVFSSQPRSISALSASLADTTTSAQPSSETEAGGHVETAAVEAKLPDCSTHKGGTRFYCLQCQVHTCASCYVLPEGPHHRHPIRGAAAVAAAAAAASASASAPAPAPVSTVSVPVAVAIPVVASKITSRLPAQPPRLDATALENSNATASASSSVASPDVSPLSSPYMPPRDSSPAERRPIAPAIRVARASSTQAASAPTRTVAAASVNVARETSAASTAAAAMTPDHDDSDDRDEMGRSRRDDFGARQVVEQPPVAFRFTSTFGSKGDAGMQLNGPMGVCFDPKLRLLFVADSLNHRVQAILMPARGQGPLRLYWTRGFTGESGCDDRHWNTPRGCALSADGQYVYIADAYNHRCAVLRSSDGHFIGAFGDKGSEPGKFNSPWAIACSPSGTVWVCDYNNHRVQAFDVSIGHDRVEARYAGQVGRANCSSGSDSDALNQPRGVVCTQSHLFVADMKNHRVQVYDARSRAHVHTLSAQPGERERHGTEAPRGLAIDASRSLLYVCDTDKAAVAVFDALPPFAPRGRLASTGGSDAADALREPKYVTIDESTGTVLVSDFEKCAISSWRSI